MLPVLTCYSRVLLADYYHTDPGKNYEDTLLDVYEYAQEAKIPYTYVLIDSWWYFKGKHAGVTDWSPMPSDFPTGLNATSRLRTTTKWAMQAHNRYWSDKNICARPPRPVSRPLAAGLHRFRRLSSCKQKSKHSCGSQVAQHLCVAAARAADAKQNGGDYDFLIQNGSGSVPLTQRFWDDFFAQSKEIIAGLEVYEQDCEDLSLCIV